MYFSMFPAISYPLTVDGVNLVPMTLTDITTRVNFNMQDEDILKIVQPYTISDQDTPESISYALYKSPYYHWTILFVNNIIDPLTDWCMSDEALLVYCQDKYGENINAPAYIVDDYGNVVGSADPQLATFQTEPIKNSQVGYSGHTQTITNYQYEILQNEKKRVIYVIKPGYLSDFLDKFRAQLAASA